MKSFETTLLDLDSNLWGHYFPVPPEICDFFKKEGVKRLLCTINDTDTIHCALTPKGDGTYFITVNKEIRKKQRLKVGDTVHLKLEEDTSKYGMPVPEEFSELFEFELEANKYFHDLTPGKQRSLLYWIGQPKTSNPRLKRALALAEHLKANKGKLDFKMLHQLLKEIVV
jgi:hypothetical protein